MRSEVSISVLAADLGGNHRGGLRIQGRGELCLECNHTGLSAVEGVSPRKNDGKKSAVSCTYSARLEGWRQRRHRKENEEQIKRGQYLHQQVEKVARKMARRRA